MENKELEILLTQTIKDRSDREFLINHWDYMPKEEQTIILKLLNRFLSLKILCVRMNMELDN